MTVAVRLQGKKGQKLPFCCVQYAPRLLAQTFSKNTFWFNFLIQIFIYLYLDTFLYYKGILAFIFKHMDIIIAF